MEKNPFLSGTFELLKHGLDHLKKRNEFDIRIAMISIDNAVELAIKTFILLNRRNFKLSRRESKNFIENFPTLLDFLDKYILDKLSTINLDELEQYHSIRNDLYHAGMGRTVESNTVDNYFIFAKDLISRLFEINIEDLLQDKDEIRRLKTEIISIWTDIQLLMNKIANSKYFNYKKSIKNFYDMGFFLDFLVKKNYFSEESILVLKNLMNIRNNIIHGESILSKEELKKNIERLKRVKKMFEGLD